jgi:carbon storage regulator
MLVLARRIGERICIGEDIVLTVTAIADGRVRIGIEAPRSMPILRKELCDREAAFSFPSALAASAPIDPGNRW